MKFKLDENIGRRGQSLLQAAGHDVVTLAEQSMQGASDRELIERVHEEGRCLVTLDLDFANPLSFPPSLYSGIAVLRLPRKPSVADLLDLVRILAKGIKRENIVNKLWIVEKDRIRIHQEAT